MVILHSTEIFFLKLLRFGLYPMRYMALARSNRLVKYEVL
jgi:hypothetical protein